MTVPRPAIDNPNESNQSNLEALGCQTGIDSENSHTSSKIITTCAYTPGLSARIKPLVRSGLRPIERQKCYEKTRLPGSELQ